MKAAWLPLASGPLLLEALLNVAGSTGCLVEGATVGRSLGTVAFCTGRGIFFGRGCVGRRTWVHLPNSSSELSDSDCSFIASSLAFSDAGAPGYAVDHFGAITRCVNTPLSGPLGARSAGGVSSSSATGWSCGASGAETGLRLLEAAPRRMEECLVCEDKVFMVRRLGRG